MLTGVPGANMKKLKSPIALGFEASSAFFISSSSPAATLDPVSRSTSRCLSLSAYQSFGFTTVSPMSLLP
jgi:hypothetical protein